MFQVQKGGKNTLFHNYSIMKAGEEGKIHESISLFPELSISLVSPLFNTLSARNPHPHFKDRNSDLSKKPGIKLRFPTMVNFFHSTKLHNNTVLRLKKSHPLHARDPLDPNPPCWKSQAALTTCSMRRLSTAAQRCSERNCYFSFRGLPLKWWIVTLIDRVPDN